ncbi:MAG: magnesium transporter [Candidatus Auribacterota bacterium]|nr:magnesium transporter [Candidatus Auribacterota bacterium]
MNSLTDNKRRLLLELTNQRETELLITALSGLHPEDVAEWLSDCDPPARLEILRNLPLKIAGEILDTLPSPVRAELVRELSPALLSGILEKMHPEEAAEVISEMKPQKAPEVLRELSQEESSEIRQFLAYPEDSAGRIMDTDLISINADMSVEEAVALIKKSTIEETLFSVYATDPAGKLLGIVPLRDLLTSPRKIPLREIMKEAIATVIPDTDQEEAAQLVKKYDLSVIPVINDDGILVGRITADDIIDIIDEETSEDIFRMAGTDEEELRTTSPFKIARIRLPWLLICIGGSFLSALVISSFEFTLARVISLVAFIPMITATGGNVGLQSSSIVIRGLALGVLKSSNLWKEVVKQIKVALWLGLACGAILTFIGFSWGDDNPLLLGLVVGLSMFLAVTFSTLTGVLIPLFFHQMKIDPAIASGPLITTLNDVLGIALYLTSATIMLGYFT